MLPQTRIEKMTKPAIGDLVKSYNFLKNVMEGSYSRDTTLAAIPNAKHPISKAYQQIKTQSVLSVKRSDEDSKICETIMVDGVRVLEGFEKWNDEELFKLAVDAPFGKGNETVYDKEVRKAFEVKADRIKFVGNHQDLDDILDNVQSFAPDGTKLEAKLYKMQIYGEGGFFKEHKDTVHAPNHFATLVIFLNSGYEGGELEVETEDRLYRFSGNSHLYAVFYTDMMHRVLPVTKGTRVVLQYDLFLQAEKEEASETEITESTEKKRKIDNDESQGTDEEASEGEDDDASEIVYDSDDDDDDMECCIYDIPETSNGIVDRNIVDKNRKRLISLLEKHYESHPNSRVFFLLNHEYPLSAELKHLRGVDRMLKEDLSKSHDMALSLASNWRPFMRGGDDDMWSNSEDHKFLHILDLSKFQPKYVSDDEEEDETPVKEEVFIFVGSSAHFRCTHHVPYQEYTGNEAQEGENTYCSLVLAIEKKHA